MKKQIFVLILLVFLMLIFVLPSVARMVGAGNLECSDLTGCSGGASCGGPGTPDGCIIDCEDGTIIACNVGT